jgi:creatinine amidohydrolase
LNSHAGNQYIARYLADRLNQETEAIAIDLDTAIETVSAAPARTTSTVFDRHAGVSETARGMYLFPSLAEPQNATANHLTLPPHLQEMLPLVNSGDQVATLIFLAEALKPVDTGKRTSTKEMTATGAWSERDTHDATAAQGQAMTTRSVDASVTFIERWKRLRPLEPLSARQKYDPPKP